jgi:hypothetical protein
VGPRRRSRREFPDKVQGMLAADLAPHRVPIHVPPEPIQEPIQVPPEPSALLQLALQGWEGLSQPP